ncbi:hypothetical protein [Serratia quinivorans]|uniref:hypothetical protein n=1 Tax=Serratia quinivorans TaxID=137545 RepID=UPI003F99241E
MKIYWSRRQIPELQTLPRAERNRHYRAAYFMTYRHWEGWAGLMLYIALIWLFIRISYHFYPQIEGDIGHFLQILLTVSIPAFIWNQISIYLMRKYYRHILIYGTP